MAEESTNPREILDDIWSRLELAARDPKHPWHWPAVATTSRDGSPTVRTIVLREVDRHARLLTFFTDARSPKVMMLRADSRISFCFNDLPANIQLRVAATASVSTDGEVVAACWRTVPPPTRAAYAQQAVPGTTIHRWNPKPTPTGEEGRENFAVVRCAVNEIDWLKLHPAGHYRIRFTFAADGAMNGSWLAP